MSLQRGTLLLVTPLVTWITIAGIIVGMPILIDEEARATATLQAEEFAEKIKLLRDYYSRSIVGKVTRRTDIIASEHHEKEPNAIPLPATFVHDLSNRLGGEGMSFKLVSAYPFPTRQARQMDAFEEMSWSALSKGANGPFIEYPTLPDGRKAVRVAVPDYMKDQTCVDCHNSHPDSPKTNWRLGDLRGILVLNVDITPTLESWRETERQLIGILIAVGCTITLVAVAVQRGFKRASDQAAWANKTKSNFIAQMSHEFRTPLNAIIGFSEVMRQELHGPIASEKYRDYTSIIHSSGQQMLGMVDDLLDIAKIEAGKQVLEQSSFDAKTLLEDCIRETEPTARSKELVIRTEVSPSGLAFYGDQRAVTRIVLNLLSNAIKFSRDGGAIDVNAIAMEDSIHVSIQDHGIGIDPETLPTLSEPFTRANLDPEVAREGTGLGLYIVKSLVEAHDGIIRIQSELDVGTTVTVEFPNKA